MDQPHLREFKLIDFALDESSLLSLAPLISLVVLEVTVTFDPSIYLHTLGFPSLSDLTIIIHNINHADSLLKLITSTHLRHVQFNICHRSTSADLQDLLQTLSDHPAKMALESVAIAIHAPWSQIHIPFITPANIMPLLELKNLKSVSIDMNCDFGFNDALLNDMALAWPNLTTLVFVSGERRIHDSMITLIGLVPFAIHCPHLDNLGLTIDARRIPNDYRRVKPGG